MSSITFKKATKHEAKLRLALVGPSGTGKTYSALSIGQHLGNRIAVIDTERGSASKYADLFSFDVLELDSFHPQTYIDAIHAAEGAGFDVLVIDSLSHAWMGKDGALELVDKASKRPQNGGNNFSAWRDVTPLHNALIDAILGSRMHVIATMRAKTEYVMEANKQGKMVPRKVGMAAVQRDGMEYEFDVVGDLTIEHDLLISKSRCPALAGEAIQKPGEQLAVILNGWLSGAPAEKTALKAVPSQEAQTPAVIAQTTVEAIRSIAQRKGVDVDAQLLAWGKPELHQLAPAEADKLTQWLEGRPDTQATREPAQTQRTPTQQKIRELWDQLKLSTQQGIKDFYQYVDRREIPFDQEITDEIGIPDTLGNSYANNLADRAAFKDDPII